MAGLVPLKQVKQVMEFRVGVTVASPGEEFRNTYVVSYQHLDIGKTHFVPPGGCLVGLELGASLVRCGPIVPIDCPPGVATCLSRISNQRISERQGRMTSTRPSCLGREKSSQCFSVSRDSSEIWKFIEEAV